MYTPTGREIESFYRASAAGLRLLDAKQGRGLRFGEAADAKWRALGGELEERDRLDLLLRDGTSQQPLAFAPRLIFQLAGLASDEPFGRDWPQAPAGLAASLLRNGGAQTDDPLALLTTAATAWGLPPLTTSTHHADNASRIGPASRVFVAGAKAVFALIEYARSRRDLDLTDQAILLADTPAERHLWGLALLALGQRREPRVLTPDTATVEHLRSLSIPRFDVFLVSEDTSAEILAASRRLTEEAER